MCYSSLNTLNS